MGGTDNIENPGHFLHRASKRVSYMGVLSAAPKIAADAVADKASTIESATESAGDMAADIAAAGDMAAAAAAAAPGREASGTAAAGAGPRMDACQAPSKESLAEWLASRNLPFATVSEPLYPDEPLEEGPVKPPRWRGG